MARSSAGSPGPVHPIRSRLEMPTVRNGTKDFLGRERDCHINPLQSKQPFLFIYQSACRMPCKTSKNKMKPRNLLWEAVMVIKCVPTQTSRDRCGFAVAGSRLQPGSTKLCWSISTPSLMSGPPSRLPARTQLLLDPRWLLPRNAACLHLAKQTCPPVCMHTLSARMRLFTGCYHTTLNGYEICDLLSRFSEVPDVDRLLRTFPWGPGPAGAQDRHPALG